MNLTQWQTKPAWSEYEAQLLDRGYEPTWDPDTERAVRSAGITCCQCWTSPVYVGMTDGVTTLGFLACAPDCGEWIWFAPPLSPPEPEGGR